MGLVFNNITENAEFISKLDECFDQLIEILQDHAGPFASNALIGSRWRQHNDVDEFTKDGIRILRHLISDEDPISRLAVRLTRFIGIVVDKRCHDGTTTSMLLFCRLAMVVLWRVSQSNDAYTRLSTVRSLTRVIDFMMDEITRIKLTEDDFITKANDYDLSLSPEEAKASIAFYMSMISSKGDVDLSSKIAEVVKSTPKNIYGMFRTIPLGIETEERYILKKQEFDFILNADISNISDLNYMNNSQYISNDAVLFITGNEIVSESYESIFLSSFISTKPNDRMGLDVEFGCDQGWEAFHENKRNLVILTPLFNDPNLMMIINQFNKANPNCKITMFSYRVHPRINTSANKAMHYIAGKPIFTDVMGTDALSSFIGLDKKTNIRVEYAGSSLRLYNMYDRTDEVYHPLYTNKDAFEPYTQFIAELEEMIDFGNKNVSNPVFDENELNQLTSFYRTLTCQTIYDIEIGGSIHDQRSNLTVYQDAIGAALSAINEGVVLGGYGYLAARLKKLYDETEDNDKHYDKSFLSDVISVLKCVINDTLKNDDDDDYIDNFKIDADAKNWSYIASDIETFLNNPGQHVYTVEFDKTLMEKFINRDPSVVILLQAWSGYHEQLKRFKSILSLLTNTNRLADMRVKDTNDLD